MAKPGARTDAVRYLPGPLTVALAATASTTSWLLALGALAITVWLVPHVGRPDVAAMSVPRLAFLCLASLGLASLSGVWSARWALAAHRIRGLLPPPLLEQQRYGDLAGARPGESGRLRPVGMAAPEVAARTDELLTHLTVIPSVRIFQGVRPTGAHQPVATHAVSAGRHLILVESVAWPPGRYRMDTAGRVCCDGYYIGQSTEQLTQAVAFCRRLLPRSHRVGALVVVHPIGYAGYTLPTATKELSWTLADEVPAELQPRLAPHAATVSRHIIAALVDTAPAGTSVLATPAEVPAGAVSTEPKKGIAKKAQP